MASAEIELDARDYSIAGVTVYPLDRAIVQRRFPINVQSGQNSVAIKCLSSVLDGDSIRVQAETRSRSQDLTVFDVVYSAPATYTYVPTKVDTPETKALEKQKTTLGVRVKAVERNHALLKDYSHSLRAGRIQGVSSDQLASFMDMNLERDTQLWEQKQKLEEDIKELEDKIAGLSVKEEAVPPLLRSGVTVVLLAKEAGPIDLIVSYAVTRASWFSLYDIRADLSEAPRYSKLAEIGGPTVRLQYRASITQSTGENWEDVTLTLSTASPMLGTVIPKVQPWYITAWKPSLRHSGRGNQLPPTVINIASPRYRSRSPSWRSDRGHLHRSRTPSRHRSRSPRRRSRSWSRSRSPTRRHHEHSLVEGLAAAAGGAAARFDAGPKIHVNDGTISSTFSIEGLSNIPSDGKSHKVSIANIDFSAELEWITVPRSLPSAFLQCRIKNASSYTLIGGPSSVFLDGNFVAKSNVPDVSPSESFTCSLGVDPAVRITYHPQSKVLTTVGKKGLSSILNSNNPKTTVTAFKQRITIKNTRASTAIAKLVVQDRAPVSEDATIKVTVSQPNEGALGPVTGVVAREVSPTTSIKEQVWVDQISKNVVARWAQKDEEDGGSGGARGDGVIEWIVSDLKDSLDLHLAYEVTCAPGTRFVDAT
ncbi:hypothetical protein DL93DRAFT_2166671 [Clavulina sp. PMI_390]|nr:hypothetical protein DL93DRAFT_2166671 [Clavulina sp. PMI_390]